MRTALKLLLLHLIATGLVATSKASMPDAPQGGLCAPPLNSGGSVVASLAVLTRDQGISPETVYFSAQDSSDPSCVDFAGGTDMTACRTGQYLGYHFDFDDPDSGVFGLTGNSRNRQVAPAPRAAHTFVCDGPGNSRWNAATEQCEYAVQVRVQNPQGDWADACVQVNIEAQDTAYAPANTWCISSDSDFTDCPAGVPAAQRVTDTPAQSLQTDFSDSRFLYQRGSSGEYAPFCVDYAERNIRVDAYGQGSDPVLANVSVGVAGSCGDSIPSAAEMATYTAPAKNPDGHVISGWAYGVSVANLRVGSVIGGMSSTLVTYHNLDLDWSGGGAHSGLVRLLVSGSNCYNNGAIDCAQVPHPYGLFVSEVVSVGNRVDANLPGVNVVCVNDCGLINSAILGSYGKGAIEHNMRIMGAWGLVISNTQMAGDHLGGVGPKAKITLRQIITGALSSALTNPEDFIAGNHAGNGPGWQRNADPTQHFTPHYTFLIDNILGDTVQDINSTEASFFSFDPGYQYSGAFGTRFPLWPQAEANTQLLGLGGRNLVTDGTVFNGHNVTCRLTTNAALPQPGYHSDHSRIYSDAPDGRCNGAVRPFVYPGRPGFNDLIFADGLDGMN